MLNGKKLSKELSPRQLEVIAELMRGSSNKAIAYELGIGVATVKVHIRSIMQKLKVRNRVQIVLCMGQKQVAASRPSLPRDVGCW